MNELSTTTRSQTRGPCEERQNAWRVAVSRWALRIIFFSFSSSPKLAFSQFLPPHFSFSFFVKCTGIYAVVMRQALRGLVLVS